MTDASEQKKTAPRKAAATKVPRPKPAAQRNSPPKVVAPKATAPKVPAPKVPAPTVLPFETTTVAPAAAPARPKAAILKMKDLVDQVVAASGGKKKGVKEIVEATLSVLGSALSKGDAVNLPGFGRGRVAHSEDKGSGKPMTIKLRSQAAAGPAKARKEGLADLDD